MNLSGPYPPSKKRYRVYLVDIYGSFGVVFMTPSVNISDQTRQKAAMYNLRVKDIMHACRFFFLKLWPILSKKIKLHVMVTLSLWSFSYTKTKCMNKYMYFSIYQSKHVLCIYLYVYLCMCVSIYTSIYL